MDEIIKPGDIVTYDSNEFGPFRRWVVLGILPIPDIGAENPESSRVIIEPIDKLDPPRETVIFRISKVNGPVLLPGDRVKVVSSGEFNGLTGIVVEEMQPAGHTRIALTNPEGRIAGSQIPINDNYLYPEPYDPAIRPLMPGDRVAVIDGLHSGSVGVWMGPAAETLGYSYVRIIKNTGEPVIYSILNEDLAPNPKPGPVFKPGDRVRVKDGSFSGNTGIVGANDVSMLIPALANRIAVVIAGATVYLESKNLDKLTE